MHYQKGWKVQPSRCKNGIQSECGRANHGQVWKEGLKNRESPISISGGVTSICGNWNKTDIAFAVCQLSRHLENPSEEHWNAAIRVLRYLKSTLTSVIYYRCKPGVLKRSAYSDAYWGSKKDNRRSTSGVTVIINNSPVIFKSKLQHSVSKYRGSRICGTFCCPFRKCCGQKVYCWRWRSILIL